MAEITKFEIGSRVYYKDNGSFDTGTITRVEEIDGKPVYAVDWDSFDASPINFDSDLYSADQLASGIY